jgi:hypothetical protein
MLKNQIEKIGRTMCMASAPHAAPLSILFLLFGYGKTLQIK